MTRHLAVQDHGRHYLMVRWYLHQGQLLCSHLNPFGALHPILGINSCTCSKVTSYMHRVLAQILGCFALSQSTESHHYPILISSSSHHMIQFLQQLNVILIVCHFTPVLVIRFSERYYILSSFIAHLETADREARSTS